jgi:hypothetical protein
MIDVHPPTPDGRELLLTRYPQPEPELRLLFRQLKLELPPQPPAPSPSTSCSEELSGQTVDRKHAGGVKTPESAKTG